MTDVDDNEDWIEPRTVMIILGIILIYVISMICIFRERVFI